MSELVPPPPPPPPIISSAPVSDEEDDDDKVSSESSESETDSDATPIPSSIPIPPPPPPAPASEPVTSADVAVEDTPAPAKDDRKLWERPWSLKELKNATESWTLAADAGVSYSELLDFIYIIILKVYAVLECQSFTQFLVVNTVRNFF